MDICGEVPGIHSSAVERGHVRDGVAVAAVAVANELPIAVCSAPRRTSCRAELRVDPIQIETHSERG